MQASYKRDLKHNYLILSTSKEVPADSYPVRMLVGNPPQQLLRCTIQTIDNQLFFYYEITAKQSLASIYEHQKMKNEDLQVLFGELIKCIEEMRSYLLEAGSLLLKPEYIYLNAERKQAFFSFFPVEPSDTANLFRELAEYLLPKIDHADQAAVSFGYGIYRRAVDNMVYLDQIKAELYREVSVSPLETDQLDIDEELLGESQKPEDTLLNSFFAEEEEKSKIHPAVSTIVIAVTGLCLFLYFYFVKNSRFSWYVYGVTALILLCLAGITGAVYFSRRRKKSVLQKSKGIVQEIPSVSERFPDLTTPDAATVPPPLESSADREEESIQGDETIVLVTEKPENWPCLTGIHPMGLQPILIKREIFLLGKLETIADAVLPSPAVSRMHAKIIKEEENYWICDLSSRNGTFVNNNLVSGNEKYKLQDGDKITFGELTYCFHKSMY